MHSAEGHRLLRDVLTVMFIVLFFLLPSLPSVYLENKINIFILQCWLCRFDSCISDVCCCFWGSCLLCSVQSNENILLPPERLSPFCVTTCISLMFFIYIYIFIYVCLKQIVLRSSTIQGWYTLPCVFICVCVCMYVYTPPTPTPVSGKKEKKEAKEAVQMAWGFFPTPCCAE